MNDLLNLSPDEWTAVRLSIRVATVAMFASLPVGIAVAYLLARTHFPGKSIVNGIVLLPLILPPVVTGYLLLLSFGRRGPIGAFLDQRGARLRGHGVSPAGPLDPALDRSGRPPPGRRGRHARRQPALGVPVRHPAADPAGNHRRHDPVLRQGHG